MWLWLRRLIRHHSRPIPMSTAEKWDFRLSVLYGLLAWNAVGFTVYMIFSGRADWPSSYGVKDKVEERAPSEQFADILGIKKAHVIQISGFKKVREFDIDTTATSTTEEKTVVREPSHNVVDGVAEV